MLQSKLLALLITFTAAIVWLRLNDTLAHRGLIDPKDSRKIIHIGTGPLFVLCWLFFPPEPISRYFAALVPFTITLQFLLVGLGIIKDEAAVKAMSRTGDRREILRGPLYYGIIFVLITILYWKDSPIGIIALMIMCGGDGLAELIGRNFGKHKLPWSTNKTWAGSLAMFLGGFLTAFLIITIYQRIYPVSELSISAARLAVISFATTLIESLPLDDIDNVTISVTAIILGHILT